MQALLTTTLFVECCGSKQSSIDITGDREREWQETIVTKYKSYCTQQEVPVKRKKCHHNWLINQPRLRFVSLTILQNKENILPFSIPSFAFLFKFEADICGHKTFFLFVLLNQDAAEKKFQQK